MASVFPPVGIVLVTHERLGEAFIDTITHILGDQPTALEAVCTCEDPLHDTLRKRIAEACLRVNHGRGVLLLVDVFGSTPSNFCCELVDEQQVVAMAGVNLPLLLRALSHRQDLNLSELIEELERQPHHLIQKLSRIPHHESAHHYPNNHYK